MRCPRLEDLPAPPAGKTGWPWTEETPPAAEFPLSNSSNSFLPKITVVTPSYNQAFFIEETIRSVLLQGYPDLEYIVMDGGSDDGSVEVIRKYEKFLDSWTSGKDGGAADAIKKGFERATGTVFAYLNSDDIYLAGALNKVGPLFAKEKGDLVYGNMHWMDRGSILAGERRQTPFSRLGYIYGGADLPQQATFWTANVYQKSGGMDPAFQFAFDMDLFARFMADGARFVHVRDFLAAFRLHTAQKSDVINDVGRRETDQIRNRYSRFPARSIFGSLLRNAGRMQRIFWYMLQGDLGWLIGRIPDRVLSHTAKGQPVGPRSRWM